MERGRHTGEGGGGCRGRRRTGREATSTNINQLEKQEERLTSRPARLGLFFQNERPREELGWGVETSPDGLDPALKWSR